MKGAINYVAIATVIFSHVNITCYFHMRRYQVFARKLTWYFIGVYIIYIRHLKITLIGAEPTIWLLRLVWVTWLWRQNFFPDKELCKIFFPSIIRYIWKIFFQCRNFFRNVFSCKEFFRPKLVCRNFFSEITHTPLAPQESNGRPLMKAYSVPFMRKIIF